MFALARSGEEDKLPIPDSAPKKPPFRAQVILTVNVLTGACLLLAFLWFLDHYLGV